MQKCAGYFIFEKIILKERWLINNTNLIPIGKFSAITGIEQHTLRHYDSLGLLLPVKRTGNKYRYYEPRQIYKLNYIRFLVEMKVPLSTIKELDENRTPERVLDLLDEHQAELLNLLNDITAKFSINQTYRNNIRCGLNAVDGEIKLEKLPATRLILGEQAAQKNEETYFKDLILFCESAQENRVNLRSPIGGFYNDMDAFTNMPGRPDKFFTVDNNGSRVCPAGQYLVGYKCGYYGEYGDLPEKMITFAKKNNLIFNGPVYVIYLLNEVSTKNDEGYVSRVMVEVSEAPSSKKAKGEKAKAKKPQI
jgi:DNA-binding transcriptional MerR regulator